MSKEILEFQIEEHEDFKDIFITGAFGGLNPLEGYIVLHFDHPTTSLIKGKPGIEKTDKIIRTKLIRIHMSPTVWKIIATWMANNLSTYEKNFGKIPEIPKGSAKEKARPSSVYG